MRRLAITLAVLLSSCGSGGGGDPVAPAAALVAKVTISPEVTSLSPGATVQLTARAYDGQNREITFPPANLQWISYSAGYGRGIGAVVSMSETGLLTALIKGTTTYAARINGVQRNVDITVQ